MAYRNISHRAQVIYSLKQASHLTSRYSAPLLGSNLPLPLSVPETISSVCCEAFGAGFVMRRWVLDPFSSINHLVICRLQTFCKHQA